MNIFLLYLVTAVAQLSFYVIRNIVYFENKIVVLCSK